MFNTNKVGMPGAKGRINISNNYVATSDGWVCAQINGTGNGAYIHMMSSDGYAHTVIGFSAGNIVNGLIPIRKGATFSYSYGSCTILGIQFNFC